MNTIKVLGICGGPRKGNAKFLLGEAVKELQTLEIPSVYREFSFFRKSMQPCIACHACTRNGGNCILKDDFEELRSLWLKADVVIYAFPVFAQGVPGQLKCFIDRLGNSLYGKYEVGSMRHMKTIVPIAVGAHLFGGEELAINQIIQHAVLVNCIPVSGDGPESYIGAPAWTRNDLSMKAMKELYETGEEDALISIKAARSNVRRAVELATLVKCGAEQLKELLSQDKRYFAYYLRNEEVES